MFDNYVGQKDALEPLVAAITASRETGRPLPNMLFLGGPGRGKTTLAKAVAQETGKQTITLHGSSVLDREDVAKKILAAQNGILFIDEVHALPRILAEDLYRVIDEHKMTVEVPQTETKFVQVAKWVDDIYDLPETERWLWHGPNYYNLYEYQVSPTKKTENQVVHMDPITIIGATTDEALLPEPFYSRLSALTIRLREYNTEELVHIAHKHASTRGAFMTPEAAQAVAGRSRQSPRRVEHLTAQAVNFAMAYSTPTISGDYVVDKNRVEAMLRANGIDQNGLEAPHRNILAILERSPRGLSRTTLAQSVGLPPRNLEAYWGDLVALGLVQISTRHEITDKGKEAL